MPKIPWTPKQFTIFNQLQLRPLVYMASPLPLFWVASQRNLLICLVTPGSTSGSTSTCPWLQSKETLPADWPVCKFDLILYVLFILVAFSILASIAACHLPLYQCIASAFRILVLPVSFIVPYAVAVLVCALVNYLVNRTACDETKALCYIPHHLKPVLKSSLVSIYKVTCNGNLTLYKVLTLFQLPCNAQSQHDGNAVWELLSHCLCMCGRKVLWLVFGLGVRAYG